ncbi:methyl-accepting chemotaxis protein [uncultured Aquitalea sp.]|uniref:methyl-accepting chemotaxis protein n=1 Tax=uncultured Aquitalea sp. TaxID=540272 RepID=UPI0025ECAC6D|nr:methyl-accepting chemotaxis protein [uncultured Aquitalea sp.]
MPLKGKGKLIGLTAKCAAVSGIFLLGGAAGYAWLDSKLQTDLAASRKLVIDQQANHLLTSKQAAIEGIFNAMYQNIRTISLLPSVRAINGGNRTDDKQDIVAEHRFSADAFNTVQQIFNNLATKASVSEVYGVMLGLDAGKGQVPFFMFDTVHLTPGEKEPDEPESKDPDKPKEVEDEEYSYFPKQMAQLQASYPGFTFKSLDDIPAATSPIMRTCDNKQYYSIKLCNVYDARGMLYSVPVYNAENRMSGVISSIIRANAFEAALLDVPFLVLTPKDKEEANKIGFKMPAEPGTFVLSNPERGIRIYDRRNAELDGVLKHPESVQQQGGSLIDRKLQVHSDSPWVLSYYLSPAMLDKALAGVRQTHHERLTTLAGIWAALLAASLFAVWRRHRSGIEIRDLRRIEKTITAVATSFDLTIRVSETDSPKVARTAEALNRLLSVLQKHMQGVEESTLRLRDASHHMQDSAQRLSHFSDAGNKSSSHIDRELGELSHAMQDISLRGEEARMLMVSSAQTARDNDAMLQEVHRDIQNVASSVNKTAACLDGLEHSSEKITQIVGVIESLAAQTNLLALNAAIEAARAGEAGRGFAVVADEVRKLADSTSSSTSEIDNIVQSIRSQVATSVGDIRQVEERVSTGLDSVGQASAAMNQIRAQSDQMLQLVAAMSHSVNTQQQSCLGLSDEVSGISDNARQTGQVVLTTNETAQSLNHLVAEMQSIVSQYRLK